MQEAESSVTSAVRTNRAFRFLFSAPGQTAAGSCVPPRLSPAHTKKNHATLTGRVANHAK